MPEHNSWELFQMKKYGGVERGGGGFWIKISKHYIFVGVGVVVVALFFFLLFFFQPSGQWAVGFCENV